MLELLGAARNAQGSITCITQAPRTYDLYFAEDRRIPMEGEMWSCEAHFANSTRTQGGPRAARETVVGRTSVER